MFGFFVFVSSVFAVVYGNLVAPSTRQGDLNTYYLYTRELRYAPITIPLDLEDDDTFDDLDSSLQTIVVVHGHKGDAFSTLNPAVKEGFFQREIDVNVIVVNWSFYTMQSYSTAYSAVPSVGTKLGEFLAHLADQERIFLNNLHLIGFDLGAHVVGFAGRKLDGEVARITGLDPSANQWGSRTARLSSSDAKYVEVIHTDGIGILANGLGTAIGDIDFFINGGGNQPGCLTHACSHNRAWEVFVATLNRESKLNGSPCRTNLQLTLNKCSGVHLHVGDDDLAKDGENIYRVNTARSFPY